MIYFLDNSLQLQKIVTSKNVVSAIHEHELNGLIRADVELDLAYANKFLILGIDHVGYYYKDEFYLHKIQRVEYDHINETVTIVLRHIFFEDMIFGKLIQDVRPHNRDALTVSRQTIDTHTRWQTVMTDVTGQLSTNFYWQVPFEVIEFMTENYRIDYLPKILFDGQKINGFQLHLANKIGEDKNIRIPYGSRVLELKYEEDYSEIITKLVVHGKGEEVGDGYGRRINISDVDFSRNGVESPVGSLYLEDESITNTYGNDGQTPREGREIFEDIEDVKELAEAGYQHYLQVSRPQMLFTADVADIGDVGIGDSVMIIRREYDVYFNARIHKLSVDLLYPEDAQVELGDYKHFKESKIARKTREKNNRVQGQLSDRITRLKLEADERFDNEVAQWKSEYEQALIDVHAQIEADRENMTNLIEGTRADFTDNLNAEITQTKEYAEQQAQEKAGVVGDKLDAFSERHESLVSGISSDVAELKISNGNIQAAVSDANGLASTIALSPTAIDLISDEINVTGNVNISGGVTALAVDAIEGNFSRLFTSSLTTNVIKSDHIQTDTALAKKLFATNANIDELVSRTHFSNSIKTMSIEAAKANFASATASWFGANVIESSWLNVDTALFNRFTASSAFINSLTAKSAFISNLNALDLSARRIYSKNGAHELNIEGGFMTITRSDNAKMDMNIDGIAMYNSNGSKRFSMDSTLVTSAALGTSNANVYLAPMDNGEVRVSRYSDIPGDGLVGSYRYLPIRASGMYANFWNINSASTMGGAQHLYARPLSGGELRITLNGQTTNYQNLRADEAIVNKVVVNSLHGNNRHLFLQTLTDGEVRTTIAGNSEYYMPLRTDGLFIEGGKIGFNNGGNSYIGSNSEVRFTSNRFYEGDSTVYRDIRLGNWRAASHEKYKYNIEEWNLDVLEVFRTELQLHTYKLDSEKGSENELIHQGIILRENSAEDQFPAEWREGDGFNGNKVLWWNTKAVQELAFENDNLKSEVAELKTKINKIMEMIK